MLHGPDECLKITIEVAKFDNIANILFASSSSTSHYLVDVFDLVDYSKSRSVVSSSGEIRDAY